MGFSPLADMRRRIGPAGRQSPRNSRIRGFTIHHQAGVNAHGQATAAGREVSANYWITNEGVIIPNIDETMRAWTTGAAGYPGGAESDHRNITVEVSNSPDGVRTGSWAISDAAMKSLIALIGDVFKRHNLGVVKRGTHGGVAVHRDFVPTACPGPYIMGKLKSIISSAESARKGTSTKPKKGLANMNHFRFDHAKKQTLKSDGKWRALRVKDGRSMIVNGPSKFTGSVNLNMSGITGDGRVVVAVRQAGYLSGVSRKPGRILAFEYVVPDKKGAAGVNLGFAGKTAKMWKKYFSRIYVEVRSTQSTPVVVNRVRAEGLFERY